MKKLAKCVLLSGAMLTAGSASAFGGDWQFCPSVGIDYKQVWLRNRGDGEFRNFTSRSFPGATAYVGAKFSDCIGFELGYDWSARKTRDHFFSVAAPAPIGLATVGVHTSTRLRQGYFDLQGFLPLDNCFELFGGIGVGIAKADIRVSADVNGGASDRLGTFHSSSKAFLRLNAGARYMITPCVGIRGKIGWENFSRLHLRHDNTFAGVFPNASSRAFRDAISLSLGLFLNF